VLGVGLSLRLEIVTVDLDAVVAFSTQVLDFTLVRDERAHRLDISGVVSIAHLAPTQSARRG
jgi:hypothetical protein